MEELESKQENRNLDFISNLSRYQGRAGYFETKNPLNGMISRQNDVTSC